MVCESTRVESGGGQVTAGASPGYCINDGQGESGNCLGVFDAAPLHEGGVPYQTPGSAIPFSWSRGGFPTPGRLWSLG